MRRWLALAAAGACAATRLQAQATGVLSGRVRDAVTGAPLALVRVVVDGGPRGAVSDTLGNYRIRELRSGWHRVSASRIGYAVAGRDSVLLEAGAETDLDFALRPEAVPLGAVTVPAVADPVLDPLVTADIQRIDAGELRRLPVTTVQEALALQAGAVAESYRGGRPGEDAFVLDGLGVKNQVDASTGGFGLRVPPDLLTEANLITNGFSARYGQAISGLINVVTKDGGSTWRGRAAYESGRMLPGSLDPALDRLVVAADGPLVKGIGFVGVLDAEARRDADPVNAPPPPEPGDPRAANPDVLPHNSGERLDAAAKLTIPLSPAYTLRLFAMRSLEQRLLYDPEYKYDEDLAPARRVGATYASAHVQRSAGAFVGDLRLGYFDRDFIRGPLTSTPGYRLGAATLTTFHFLDEDLARARDTVAARAALPGFTPPDFSVRTPWGVPAFFQGVGPRGDLGWNHFRELRARFDGSVGASQADLAFGGEVALQRVQTFQRALAYLPVSDSGVPPTAAADFRPLLGSLYVEPTLHGQDFALTLGMRYDRFDPGGDVSRARPPSSAVSPRVGFSTALHGVTLVWSWGRFNQPPDYQYLVDAAFDDTARTGRFRRGNPNLGFERATQWEFSLRARPMPLTSLRVHLYRRALDGLVASVPLGINPDSTIFNSFDFGTVQGVELLVERDLHDGWGVRVSYTLQGAQATATNAFNLFTHIRGQPPDSGMSNRVEFPLDFDRRHALTAVGQWELPATRGPLLGGLAGAAILRVGSGLPYSRTNSTGDTLIGLPNSWRLPWEFTLDLLVRRPLRVGPRRGSVYVDARNILNTRNTLAVRRDVGSPTLSAAGISALAEAAYAAHPEPIPYESPRYRAAYDSNGDGSLDGRAELFPLYLAAARDFTQPLFAYGAPRVMRIGVEYEF